ncbi:hypothetical protein BJV77DRAFT_623253 [Russula vinacea]|nr:hypothetical protein BJV77DRAFT_623253 [Russula vinacea]
MQTTPLPSPGFRSAEASPAQVAQQINGSSGHYHSYSGRVAGSYTPASAPPHKSGFDQPTLYAQSLEHSQPSGSGPIRRYRSVTPSVAQNGELIRRPITASSMTDYRAASPAPRGYHPYAGALASGHAPNSSTRSSPAGYHIPLEPTPLHQSQIPRAADEPMREQWSSPQLPHLRWVLGFRTQVIQALTMVFTWRRRRPPSRSPTHRLGRSTKPKWHPTTSPPAMGSRNKLSCELQVQVNYRDEGYFIPGPYIINLPTIYLSHNCSHLSLCGPQLSMMPYHTNTAGR